MEFVAPLVCVIILGLSSIFFAFRYYKTASALKNLQNKFKSNPNYETQQFMADMLRGDILFHIERVPPESVFIRRD